MLNAYHRRRLVHDRSGAVARGAVPDDRLTDPPTDRETVLDLEGVEALDRCDAYVVLVADPVTGALDSYGPLPGPAALAEAERRRRDLDAGDLADVAVEVVRHHGTPSAG